MNAIITISVFNFLGIFGNSSNNYHISGFSTKLQALSSNVKPIIQPKKNIPKLNFNISDGSDPRIGPGSARDRPFLKGLGSNFGEGPKLGIEVKDRRA